MLKIILPIAVVIFFTPSRGMGMGMAQMSYLSDQMGLGACKSQDSFSSGGMSKFMTDFLDGIICQNMGIDDDAILDKKYCDGISHCQIEEDTKSKVMEDDKDFLQIESLSFLVRESFFAEMNKYNSDASIHMRLVQGYLATLPEADRKLLKQCNPPKSFGDHCLKNPDMDKMAKNYIGDLYFKNMDVDIQQESKKINSSSDDQNIVAKKKILSVAKQADENIAVQTTESIYKNITEGEDLVTKDLVKDTLNNINPDKDEVLSKIVSGISKENRAKMKGGAFIAKIKKILKGFAHNGKEPVLSHGNEKSDEKLQKSLDKFLDLAGFDPLDLNPENKAILFSKINKLRVNIANDYIAEDCPKVNVSIQGICAKAEEQFEKGNLFSKLKLKEANIFGKMIDHYRNTNDKDKDEKIATLKRMQDDHKINYEKYLGLMIQTNICDEKFPNVKTAYKHQKIKDQAKEGEKVLKKTITSSMDNIMNTVTGSSELQSEFKKMGIVVENNTMRSVNNSVSTSNEETKPASSGGPTNSQSVNNNNKSDNIQAASPTKFLPEGNGMSQVSPFSNSPSSEMIDQTKTREKLSNLEAKEKALSGKNTFGNSSPNDGNGAPDATNGNAKELQSLRAEIESLKKMLNKSVADKESLVAEKGKVVAKNAEQGSEPVSAINSRDNFSNGFGGTSATINSPSSFTPVNGSSSFSPASSSANAIDSREANAQTVGGTRSKMPGLILSESGKVIQTPESIPNDPRPSDIIDLLEVSKGQPFMIREKGELMEVSLELDTLGKAILLAGKPRYKKTRVPKILKNQAAVVPANVNIPKKLKEVEEDPARLFNLKSLIKEQVK